MGDSEKAHILDRLSAVIESRRGDDPDSSYTARLFAKGPKKIAQKVGEEAVETIIARLAEDNSALAAESADLLYHLLVLWAEAGLEPDEVWAALEARTGTSGIEEKRSRSKS